MSVDEKKNVYHITGTKTLVDINKDTTNFEAEIIVRGTTDFSVCILSQTELDNGKIDYKKIDKKIYRDFISNLNNIYQNYFLVLKSENPQDVEVVIKLKTLPVTQMDRPPVPQMIPPPMDNRGEELPMMIPQQHIQSVNESEPKSGTNMWKIIFYVAIAIIAAYFIYHFFIAKKVKKSSTEIPQLEPSLDLPKFEPKVEIPSVEMKTPNLEMEGPKFEIKKPKVEMDLSKFESKKLDVPRFETKKSNNLLDTDFTPMKRYKFTY
jgi:hypothetical protein